MAQIKHHCPYCGTEQLLANLPASPWAFVECGTCSQRSLLTRAPLGALPPPRASSASPEASATPKKSATPPPAETRGAGRRIAPEPPPFLAPNPRKAPPRETIAVEVDPTLAAPLADFLSAEVASRPSARGRRRSLQHRGSLALSLLLIAAGLFQLGYRKFVNPAPRRLAMTAPAEAAPAPTSAVAPPVSPMPPAAITELAPPVLARAPAPASVAAADAAATPKHESPIRVEVAKNAVVLRSGPGLQFRRVGFAAAELKLIVREWRGDWFRVELDAIGADLLSAADAFSGSAWIRNDLVRPLAAGPNPVAATN